jgi:uncharacterized ferritin-like protein (DUF455 family)
MLNPSVLTLRSAACAVLNAADPAEKLRLTHQAAAAWFAGEITELGEEAPPDRPARPEKPVLAPPKDMAKRGRGGSLANRAALLHALAHIELNAIDLHWDAVARHWGRPLPKAFYDDWVRVADDEARHFRMLADLLRDLGAAYGDLPAHDGLWQSAQVTAHDLAARLAVAPMLLEARGLDVTPATVERLRGMGEGATADALQIIYEDEITHVAAGCRWFRRLAEQERRDAPSWWRELVATYFKGQLKAPFNDAARAQAGLTPDFYNNSP